MFNRLYVTQPPEVRVINNIEQKPHDPADAARLFGELKAKAEDEVREATIERLGAHNELRVAMVQPIHRFDTNEQFVRLVFSINDKKFDFMCEVDPLRMKKGVYEAVTTCILRECGRHFSAMFRGLDFPTLNVGDEHELGG